MLRFPKLLALGAGALSATGFEPLGLWPVTLACLALLMELIARAPSWRGAFLRGWLFGVGHFTLGLNWIAHAFTYQEAMPHWFGYGAVVLLSLYLAVYPAGAGLIAYTLSRSSRAPRLPATAGAQDELHAEGMKSRGASPNSEKRASTTLGTSEMAFTLLFAAAWVVTEYLRATVFTGFAWNPLGVALLDTPLAATAQAIGTYGLSALAALAAGALWLLARRDWLTGGLLAGALAGLAVLSLVGPPARPLPAPPVAVRIVQPNVSQDEKYNPEVQVDNLRRLVRMSGTPDPTRPRLLLWPEAAIDNGFYLDEDAELRRALARTLGPRDLLLSGGAAIEYDRAGRMVGARNSVFVLRPDARIQARYDKAHLVPYGEYLPMRTILTPLGLARLVPGDLDFWPGPGPQSFLAPGAGLIGFQICYEIIFSGAVLDPARRPRFVFNPSNDAWFGHWGPPQHMAQARLRAIEEGMTIVRATPTGISGVIAPNGKLVASLGQGERAVLDASLPPPRAPTLFARYGNILPGMFGLLLGGLGVVIGRRAR